MYLVDVFKMKETPRISAYIYNKLSAGEKTRTKIGAHDKLIPDLKIK